MVVEEELGRHRLHWHVPRLARDVAVVVRKLQLDSRRSSRLPVPPPGGPSDSQRVSLGGGRSGSLAGA